MTKTRTSETRCFTDEQGRRFVSVTSAMKLVRQLLNEPDEYYGPNGAVHAFEGTSCHSQTLDGLAFQHGWLPSFIPPKWEAHRHYDERRFLNVLADATKSFQEFCERYELTPLAIEQESFSVAYGLFGHIDLLAELTWKKRRVRAVIDLKFVNALMPSHELQLRCYSKLPCCRDVNLGLLFHGNRNTGLWTVKQVDLNAGLEDVAAVSYAAKLYTWAQQKGR